MRLTHAGSTGRVESGLDGGTADDCKGTARARGNPGGTTYGVAKDVGLVAVRVLSCFRSGPDSGVIKGVDWVTALHQPGQPAVTNLSWMTEATEALDQAVRGSIADGMSCAVAVGNGSRTGTAQDACGSSPGRVPEAITVSGRTETAVELS